MSLDDVTDSEPAEDSRTEEVRRRRERVAKDGGRRKRKKRRPRSGDLFFVVVLFFLILTFVVWSPGEVIRLLFNETAGLVLIVIVVEFLILKSMDRTRVFQLENIKLREARRGDRALLKRAREALSEVDKASDSESAQAWKENARKLADEIKDNI